MSSNSTSSSKNSSKSSKPDDPIMNAAKKYQTSEKVKALPTKGKRTSLKQAIKDFQMEFNEDEEVKVAMKESYIEEIKSRTANKKFENAHKNAEIAHKEAEIAYNNAKAAAYDFITAVAKEGAKKQ